MKTKSTMYIIVLNLLLLASMSNVFAKNKLILRLNQIMTPEEQKRTGVAKLTESERKALEQWLTNWTLKVLYKAAVNSGQVYARVGSGHWISEKVDRGRFILLEDGSLWEISPIDRINTMLWLVAEKIIVIENADPFYPYKLINSDSGDTAEAKLISQ